MPPFSGGQCWFSFDDKTPFTAAKALPTCHVHADLFFFKTLKEGIPDLFDVLCAENHASPEQFLRVI